MSWTCSKLSFRYPFEPVSVHPAFAAHVTQHRCNGRKCLNPFFIYPKECLWGQVLVRASSPGPHRCGIRIPVTSPRSAPVGIGRPEIPCLIARNAPCRRVSGGEHIAIGGRIGFPGFDLRGLRGGSDRCFSMLELISWAKAPECDCCIIFNLLLLPRA